MLNLTISVLRRARRSCLICPWVLLAASSDADAQNWWGPSGESWSNPANWSTGAVPPNGGAGTISVHSTSVNVIFDHFYSQPFHLTLSATSGMPGFATASVTQNVPGSQMVMNSLALFGQHRGSVRYEQSTGTMLISGSISLGTMGSGSLNGGGNYTLSGNGYLSVGGVSVGSLGGFGMSGGVLVCTGGIGGAFGMSGGTATVGGIGISGGGQLSNGHLKAGSMSVVGGNSGGSFTMSGGTFDLAGRLQLSSSSSTLPARFTLSGGKLSVGSILLNPWSTFTQGGGMLVSSNAINLGTSPLSQFRFNGGSLSTGEIVSAGGQFLMGPGTSRVARTGDISIFGDGQVDLNQGALLVESADRLSIAGLVSKGYNNGNWNGSGIVSSFAAADSGYAVGYAEADAIFNSFPASFRGEQVDQETVIVATTRSGDANLDGVVNLVDFNLLATSFGRTGAVWSQADFNYDGIVNLDDFNLLAGNFGLSASGPEVTPQDWSNLAAVVPEPGGSFTLLFCLTATLVRRRR